MLPMPPLLDPNETNWIVQVNENEQQYWKNPSIYRVPASIINLNPNAYKPQVVSFGPYHYSDLHPMEEHKHRALLHFLKRSGKPREPFFESLREVAQELEESYETLDQTWKDGNGGQFLDLMIQDGCFMLEIMRITIEEEKNDYAPYDPIFSPDRLKYLKPYIKRDMLMLENQLPIRVLHQLVAVENKGKEPDKYINELILSFYSLDTGIPGMGRILHVMDVFRKSLLEPEKVQDELENGGPEDSDEIIRSATELNEAGIQFKQSQTPSLNNIFFARGVLRLPVITVDDATESMFLNIMTFECLHVGAGTEVTSYVAFMDNIINNERDVELLHAQGIIQNAIGSDEAVAKLFNSLCKEVTLKSNSSLDAVQKKISKYCERPWNRWRANLNRAYFRSPWSILSLIAAIFLFVLTLIQTVYVVLSYY